MATEKQSFQETRFYPIVFMVLISVIFIAVLATFYHATENRVEHYAEMKLKTLILQTLQLPVDDIEKTFQTHIEMQEKNGLTLYRAQQSGKQIGYCFPISGAGLWGKIDALIAVSPDFQAVLGFEILQQNETPGLGGRITETWFTDQFKGKTLRMNDAIQKFVLIPEGEPINARQVNQISGASASSNAVVNMIHQELQKIYQQMGDQL